MQAIDIIKKIYEERGLDYPDEKVLDLVPINDLNVHKREVWSLSITGDPELYYSKMDKKFKSRTNYYYKFLVKNMEDGRRLCVELSNDFGTSPCKIDSFQLNEGKGIYLAIHIHPEFSFIHSAQAAPATQEVVVSYFNS